MNLSKTILRLAWPLYATAIFFLWPAMSRADTVPHALSDAIQKRLERALESPVLLFEGAAAYAPAVLQDIYRTRAYQPVWVLTEEPPPQADALLKAIRQAGQDGLKPEEYHLPEITALLSEWRTGVGSRVPFPVARQVDLELLLTDALVAYGSHLLNGRVNPEILYPAWASYSKDFHLSAVLENMMSGGSIEAALQHLTPQAPLYRNLMQALAVYTKIAESGGWPTLSLSRNVQKKEDHDHYLSLLRQRLILTGDLPSTELPDRIGYDESLKAAVRRFQKRHGLQDDGEVGPATLRAMNVPAEKRVEQIRINLERLRWLPEKIGDRHILVNIADFMLTVFQEGRVVMDMPIVVGKLEQRTFTFSAKMTYLELNPYWNIPKAIAKKEILADVQKDPEYLKKKKIRVIEYRRHEDREIDASTIEWSKIRPDKLRYSFRQDPGPGNALGRIKFMFPNKFNIYLHDTPERHLFKKTRRAFSHGCIRVANPIDLAEYLLKNEIGWDREKILTEIGRRKRKIVNLSSAMDIHIVYLTAWTDPQGQLQFRNDVYQGDAMLLEALNEKPLLIVPDDLRPHVKK
jgi:murein L,D-transpeptidase YcbB/YkuD